jgi:hypothetical protein
MGHHRLRAWPALDRARALERREALAHLAGERERNHVRFGVGRDQHQRAAGGQSRRHRDREAEAEELAPVHALYTSARTAAVPVPRMNFGSL